MVFDLPDLVQKKGGQVKVHHNKIYDNNHVNFAPAGNIVASVPSGTGLMILATKEIEVYQNEILNNQSAGTFILSYMTTGKPIKDKAYDPFPSAILIQDNVYERKSGLPAGINPLVTMLGNKFGENVPHIIFDGIKNPSLLNAGGNWIAGQCISIINNKGQSIANLDAANGFKNIALINESFKCIK